MLGYVPYYQSDFLVDLHPTSEKFRIEKVTLAYGECLQDQLLGEKASESVDALKLMILQCKHATHREILLNQGILVKLAFNIRNKIFLEESLELLTELAKSFQPRRAILQIPDLIKTLVSMLLDESVTTPIKLRISVFLKKSVEDSLSCYDVAKEGLIDGIGKYFDSMAQSDSSGNVILSNLLATARDVAISVPSSSHVFETKMVQLMEIICNQSNPMDLRYSAASLVAATLIVSKIARYQIIDNNVILQNIASLLSIPENSPIIQRIIESLECLALEPAGKKAISKYATQEIVNLAIQGKYKIFALVTNLSELDSFLNKFVRLTIDHSPTLVTDILGIQAMRVLTELYVRENSVNAKKAIEFVLENFEGAKEYSMNDCIGLFEKLHAN
jgi:hypothetical protein